MNTLEQVIAELDDRQSHYKCNTDIAAQLSKKRLVLFVSPASGGKSTLMNALQSDNAQFSRIGGIVSREVRSDDEPELYRYISHTAEGLSDFLVKVIAGEPVQYVVHPTKKHIYATEIQDYYGDINMKDVIGQGVAGFRGLPVKATHTFSLVCDPNEWRARLLQRYKSGDPELIKRDKEAYMNLSWSLQDSETIFIDNSNGNLARAVTQIQTYITGSSEIPDQAPLRAKAEAMLQKINY